MACCNPFIKTVTYGHIDYDYYIPCGYCLNCRKDKQQYYIDRAEYEYKKRLTASFVTFTYDDVWNLANCAVLDPNGGLEYDIVDGEKRPRFTLNYDDLTHYIDSIRKYIASHPDIQNVMCQPDFSYLYCGEYGDQLGRNHFHVLFFGLDFAYCKKILFERWKYGFIDVLPLLDGGIRYVVKYMDKQTFGALAYEQYDAKGLARPKIRMSQGFGKGLLTDNLDYIKKHDMCYPARHKTNRPISAYWKKLITGGSWSRDTSKSYSALQHKKIHDSEFIRTYDLKNIRPNTPALREYKLEKLKARERDLEISIRNAGFPVIPYDEVMFTKYLTPRFKRDVLNLPIDVQRLLSDNYRDSLYDDIVPF